MKVQDLRIGNKIIANFGKESGEREIEVFSINESGCVYDENIDEHWEENLKGIPLTEEWLVKFGFEKGGVSYNLMNENFCISMMFYGCWNLCLIEKSKLESNQVNLKGFWSVHELQNLIYALTGEELTIKTK